MIENSFLNYALNGFVGLMGTDYFMLGFSAGLLYIIFHAIVNQFLE